MVKITTLIVHTKLILMLCCKINNGEITMGKYVNNSKFSHITWINKQRLQVITEYNKKLEQQGLNKVKVKSPNYTKI